MKQLQSLARFLPRIFLFISSIHNQTSCQPSSLPSKQFSPFIAFTPFLFSTNNDSNINETAMMRTFYFLLPPVHESLLLNISLTTGPHTGIVLSASADFIVGCNEDANAAAALITSNYQLVEHADAFPALSNFVQLADCHQNNRQLIAFALFQDYQSALIQSKTLPKCEADCPTTTTNVSNVDRLPLSFLRLNIHSIVAGSEGTIAVRREFNQTKFDVPEEMMEANNDEMKMANGNGQITLVREREFIVSGQQVVIIPLNGPGIDGEQLVEFHLDLAVRRGSVHVAIVSECASASSSVSISFPSFVNGTLSLGNISVGQFQQLIVGRMTDTQPPTINVTSSSIVGNKHFHFTEDCNNEDWPRRQRTTLIGEEADNSTTTTMLSLLEKQLLLLSNKPIHKKGRQQQQQPSSPLFIDDNSSASSGNFSSVTHRMPLLQLHIQSRENFTVVAFAHTRIYSHNISRSSSSAAAANAASSLLSSSNVVWRMLFVLLFLLLALIALLFVGLFVYQRFQRHKLRQYDSERRKALQQQFGYFELNTFRDEDDAAGGGEQRQMAETKVATNLNASRTTTTTAIMAAATVPTKNGRTQRRRQQEEQQQQKARWIAPFHIDAHALARRALNAE